MQSSGVSQTNVLNKLVWLFLCAVPLIAANPSAGLAQFAPPGLTAVNPGARSSAMGGAFVGLADDATAALANPAGLVQLGAPEVSFEVRHRTLDAVIENESGVATGTTTGLAYVSFVYPKPKWAIAVFRHEAGRWKDDRGHFFGPNSGGVQVSEDVRLDTYGVSGGYLVSPRVRVGGGLTMTRGRAETTLDFSNFGDDHEFLEGTKVGANVGTLISVVEKPDAPISLFQIGAMYRWQARYDTLPFSDLEGFNYNPLALPDVFTVGAAMRIRSAATVSLEFMRLQDTEARSETGYELVPRMGFEYVLPLAWSPALRVGYWHEGNYNEFKRNVVVLGRDQIPYGDHLTFGAGASINRQFEVNFSADMAKAGFGSRTVRFRAFVGSAVIRFTK